MLTLEQKATIRAEEVFRAEIRNEIASAGRLQKPRRKLWEVLNSSFAIWFLSSVVVALISWMISKAALYREKDETLRRLKWEVYNNGKDFEHSIELAWTRLQYEVAFSQNLQNPKARVVDLKPFSFDRLTFEMEYIGEYLGSLDVQNDAKSARDATQAVWNRIVESKLSKFDWGKSDWVKSDWDKSDWDDAWLDDQTKKDLDKEIIAKVREKIITPFDPKRSAH